MKTNNKFPWQEFKPERYKEFPWKPVSAYDEIIFSTKKPSVLGEYKHKEIVSYFHVIPLSEILKKTKPNLSNIKVEWQRGWDR